MTASAAARFSIAACTSGLGMPLTSARAMSTASGPRSIDRTVAVRPDWRSVSTVFCAIRSASSRVEDGLLTPALMTAMESCSFDWVVLMRSSSGARAMYGSPAGCSEQRLAERAQGLELLGGQGPGHDLGDVLGV